MRVSNHVIKLINSLQVHYRLRVESERELELALGDFEDLLGGFEPDVLEAVRAEIARTYTGRDFPAQALLFKTAQRMHERKRLSAYAAQNPLQIASEGRPARFDDRLVGDLLRTSIGRQAASEGWAGVLRGFLRREGRLPNEREQRALKAEAAEFDKAYADIVRNPRRPLARKLLALGDAMLERRRKTERFITGDAA